MNDIMDFFRMVLPPENIFEIKIDNMESRFEEMTKEQLLAELAVAKEKNNYLRDRISKYEDEEKKREFERRIAEAKDFLNANGYEVVPATEIKRLQSKIKLDAETMRGAFIMTKGERIWRDINMIDFATIVFYRSPNEAKKLLEEYYEHFRKRKS